MAKPPSQSTINLYGQTFQQIVDKVIGGSSKGKFQLVHPFLDWTWDFPAPGYIDAKAYKAVGQLPSWSAIGSSVEVDLYTTYRQIILQCISLTQTPEDNQVLRDLQYLIDSVQETYQNDVLSRNIAWTSAIANIPPGASPPKFDDWNDSSGWLKKIAGDQSEIEKALTTKQMMVQKQNFQYEPSLKASELPRDGITAKPGFARCNIAGLDSWRANFCLSKGENWVAQLIKGGGDMLKIELNASESSSALRESWAGGATDFGSCFFGVYSSGSWHDMDLSKEDESVKVSIEIKAVTQVPVRPDGWYNGGYLKYLARLDRWNKPFTTEKVFDKDGLMPLMISGLVVGYQISFKITMPSATFQHYQKNFKESEGIRIGPFHLGGGGDGTSSDSWSKSTDGQSFSGKSTSTYPFVIGFTLATPGLE